METEKEIALIPCEKDPAIAGVEDEGREPQAKKWTASSR